MADSTTPAAPQNTEEQLVGPDSDRFWDYRLRWISDYRKRNATTIRAAMDAWKTLAGVEFDAPRPNAHPHGRAPARTVQGVGASELEGTR